MTQRGAALLSVLALLVILLPLGAFVVLQSRMDLHIGRSYREEVEAFYVSEAGLEHAIAEIRPGQSFADIVAGPDRVAGTADDGQFPFPEGSPAPFPAPPFHYDVRVSAAPGDALSITSQGYGRNSAAAMLKALVEHSPSIWAPAALLSDGHLEALDLGDGAVLLSGFDHRVGDAPAHPTGTAAAVAAVADHTPEAVAAARAHLDPALAGRLVGAGGPPSIATAPGVDMESVGAQVARIPGAVLLDGIGDGSQVNLGTRRAPQATVVRGDIDGVDGLTGSGILVVRGRLHVSGSFAFTGLVVALGGIALEPTSTVNIAGALWCGGEGQPLQFRGSGSIVYSSEALAEADAFSGVLPHAIVVAGWFEQM